MTLSAGIWRSAHLAMEQSPRKNSSWVYPEATGMVCVDAIAHNCFRSRGTEHPDLCPLDIHSSSTPPWASTRPASSSPHSLALYTNRPAQADATATQRGDSALQAQPTRCDLAFRGPLSALFSIMGCDLPPHPGGDTITRKGIVDSSCSVASRCSSTSDKVRRMALKALGSI